MKKIHLLHNPTAGGGKYDKKNLTAMVEAAGYECSYSSTKKEGWGDNFLEYDPDIIAVAGGDGTVRKLAKELLNRKVLDKVFPVSLLSLGTANNIAKALGMHDEPEKLLRVISKNNRKKFDIGRIFGLKGHRFFMEGFGYGVFPTLIKQMREKKTSDDPEESKAIALQTLHDIIYSFKPRRCKIITDDVDHSGDFILAEIMNIRSIGPNLNLVPSADPGDGAFDIVLISEKQREEFAQYVANKLNGREESTSFPWMKASNIEIEWEGTHLHLDDEIVSVKKDLKINIELRKGLLEFFVP